MKVKSMKSFRNDFKMSKAGTSSDYWDPDFMGYAKRDISGFFCMYHGTKSDIPSFLRKEIEMAEDGQAVYEFIQNAADSNSTHFYMFYNDKYLLTINNGEAFEQAGIESILNAGQSYGKNDSPDKIGRFGIGFKLVHRLVGKNNGLDELCKEYKGPQLFSWSRKEDFDAFCTSNTFEEETEKSGIDYPWLMKIIITNFPTSVDEKVRNIDFVESVPFPKEEVKEFQTFMNENLHKIDASTMNHGTSIFIKLGENKIDLLNKDQSDINSRLENTLYFLKSITHLQVNDKVIQA